MPDHPTSTAPVAAARIWAVFQAVKALHQDTGGDPAEAVYELISAATLILLFNRTTKPPAEMVAEIAPMAETTVREWFASKIAEVRHGDH